MKTYCKPSIRVKELDIDAAIMAASETYQGGGSLDGVKYGGENQKPDIQVDSKSLTNSALWDDDEE